MTSLPMDIRAGNVSHAGRATIRHCLVCLLVIGLNFVLGVSLLRAQIQFDTDEDLRLTIAPPREALLAIEQARRDVAEKQYLSAVRSLQSVLDEPEDYFLTRRLTEEADTPLPKEDGAEQLPRPAARKTLKREVIELFRTLPSQGWVAYETEYGAVASEILKEGFLSRDRSRLTDVIRKYPFTVAGQEALTALAADAIDRRQPVAAAQLLSQLVEHPRALPAQRVAALWQQAACWQIAHRPELADWALKEALRIGKETPVNIGGKRIPTFVDQTAALTWLKPQVEAMSPTGAPLIESWSMPGGSSSRNVGATEASPIGGEAWMVSLLELKDFRQEGGDRRRQQMNELLPVLVDSLAEQQRLAMPAAQPLVVGDVVVYRTLTEVTAVSLTTGRLMWRSALADGTIARLWTRRTTDPAAEAGDSKPLTPAQIDASRLPSSAVSTFARRCLFRDATFGTLSSDGKAVFAIEACSDDQMVGLVPTVANPFAIQLPEVTNKLVAYDLTGGRLMWEVGGQRGTQPFELSGHFFLGPPLPLEGRLYCLAEQKQELKLIVLSPPTERGGQPEIEWSQSLMAAYSPLMLSPQRRLSGLMPSYAEGVLVCPTSAGAVIAVDLAQRTILWGQEYRSMIPKPPVDMRGVFRRQRDPGAANPTSLEQQDEQSRWIDSPPVIASGRILVCPRDNPELYCFDLQDGRLLWALPREDRLMVAAVDGNRVTLLRRNSVEFINLDSGKPLEDSRVALAEVSGRPVRVGNLMYIPQATGDLATVNLISGKREGSVRLPAGRRPGNLVAGSGAIVSQGLGELTGFARRSDIERQITDHLKSDPAHPVALALRGELKLHHGDSAGGSEDLRQSLKQRPDNRIKGVLASHLLTVGRESPDAIKALAAELETLADEPALRCQFLQLHADALEATGDKRGATLQRIRLAGHSAALTNMERIDGKRTVRVDRVLRAKLQEAYSSGSAEDRAAFDQAIGREIAVNATSKNTGNNSDTAALPSVDQALLFLRSLPGTDKAALGQTASRSASPERQKRLENLACADDSTTAARALWQLSQDQLQAGHSTEAKLLLKRLLNEFPASTISDGQTIGDVIKSRRDIPAPETLSAPDFQWGSKPIDVSRIALDTREQRQEATVRVAQIQGTMFRDWTFDFDAASAMLTGRDGDGLVRWKVMIPSDQKLGLLRTVIVPPSLHVRNGWIGLNLGTHFVVLDARATSAQPRVAWQESLRIPAAANPDPFARRFQGNGPFGRGTSEPSTPQGHLLGLTSDTAIWVVGKVIFGTELESGRTVWTRPDLLTSNLDLSETGIDVSVDDRHLALVFAPHRSATILRTLTGETTATRDWDGDSFTVWLLGTRRLSTRVDRDNVLVELQDLATNSVIWSRKHNVGTRAVVVEDRDVAILEPTGRLTLVQLPNGDELRKADIPLKIAPDNTGWFTVRRLDDRDIYIGGTILPGEGRSGIVTSREITIPFDGVVCAVSRADGKVLWTLPVTRGGFDATAPARLPILLLSVGQSETADDPFRDLARSRSRLTAQVIDLRSGRSIYSTSEISSNVTPQLRADREHRRIVANFQEWQLELLFPAP